MRPAPLALLLSLASASCAPASRGAGGELPSPRDAAKLPVSSFAPNVNGPGLGPELVFTARGATLSGETLTLPASTNDGASLAIVRWLGLTPGLLADVAFAAAPSQVDLASESPSASSWSFSSTAPALDGWATEGTLLLAARNATSAPITIDLALTFTVPASLPAWTTTETFPVPELPEPSGIDYDFRRDRLWVVDDSGTLGRVHPETGVVEATADLDARVAGPADLEAVRWVPGLDVLLLANEAADQLLVVSPDSLALLATATLVYSSGLTPVPTSGGDGIEGLAVTSVTDRTVHLILANQNDPHGLYEASLALPTTISGSLTANVTAAHPQPRYNLSEVMMDWGSRRLFVVHGYGNDRIVRLDTSFTETTEMVSLPVSTEGATLRGASLHTAQDLGGTTRSTP